MNCPPKQAGTAEFREPAARGVQARCSDGVTHAVNATPHGRRLTALGALELDGPLHYALVRGAARSADLIGFLDRLVAEPGARLTCVVLDNASLHTSAAVAARASAWLIKGLWLHVLPAYSPELNPIEILWKHAKHFWRRFVAWQPASLHDEVDRLLQGYGSKFQISFK